MITADILIARGYKEYPVPVPLGRSADRFFQKRIDLEDDEKLYIDVYFYDFAKYGQTLDRYRYTFSTQLNTETDCCFNVETVAWTDDESSIGAAEELFLEMYRFAKPYRRIKTKEED